MNCSAICGAAFVDSAAVVTFTAFATRRSFYLFGNLATPCSVCHTVLFAIPCSFCHSLFRLPFLVPFAALCHSCHSPSPFGHSLFLLLISISILTTVAISSLSPFRLRLRFLLLRWLSTSGAHRRLRTGPARLPRPHPLPSGVAASPRPGAKERLNDAGRNILVGVIL